MYLTTYVIYCSCDIILVNPSNFISVQLMSNLALVLVFLVSNHCKHSLKGRTVTCYLKLASYSQAKEAELACSTSLTKYLLLLSRQNMTIGTQCSEQGCMHVCGIVQGVTGGI